ncbi:MAG: Grx4 family monothiol glutaredoxin [Candidatus Omnitrophica bacterium]|nr:Grx4 family monothiol glutaredoxin [Candidatus Omnitrophota bacterium]
MTNTTEKIQSEIRADKIVIFMKGTPDFPQCGFSAKTVEIFKSLGFPFHTVDILAHPDIRALLPQISNWPTFPQVFVKGKLIGGCDIVSEMHSEGQLKPLLESAFKDSK